MEAFRLATINVHSFHEPTTYDSNVKALIEILKPYDLDLVAVQEIQNDKKWSEFCKGLCLNNSIYGPCTGTSFGNGIASRYPIAFHSNKQSDDYYEGGRRSLLQCCLNGDHPFVKDRTFAVTHLDHLNENARLKQIKEFASLQDNVDILMGDMNSLTKDDYSHDYYEKNVLGLRKKSNWEQPQFDLTNFITNKWSFQDAFKTKNPNLKDEQLSTCRFGTRIDYIYLRPRMDDSWALKECSIINTQNATDHNAVFAVFEQQ